jgi:hypothetical protein
VFWNWLIGILVITFGFVVIRGAPYVPSRTKYINRAFDKLYKLGNGDVLVDLGSGDGIVLRLASRQKAKAIGYEMNPILVIISRILSIHDQNVKVRMTDFWLTKFPDDTTIVYVFITTNHLKKLAKKMQQESNRLKRPLKLMTYGGVFSDIKPDDELEAYRLYTFFPLQTDEA